MKFLLITLSIAFFLFSSCNKEDLRWNLKKEIISPVITQKGVFNIRNQEVSIRYEVSFDGGDASVKHGVCWSTNNSIRLNDLVYSPQNGQGEFSVVATGLNQNTSYYFWAFAINAADTVFSDVIFAKTSNVAGTIPSLITSSIQNISSTGAFSGGESINPGTTTILEKGVVWSNSPQPTLSNSKTMDGNGVNNFSSQISNCTPNVRYYVRAYATNAIGTGYGNERTFTTTGNQQSPVLVGSLSGNNLNGITSRYQGMNGTSAAWGISPNGYNGTCFAAPDPNNSGQLGSAIGTHYLQFSRTFAKNGYIEFWSQAYNPGGLGITPKIYVDGVLQSTPTVVGGQLSWSTFAKFKSAPISAGARTIKIEYQCQYYIIYLDEIEFYE